MVFSSKYESSKSLEKKFETPPVLDRLFSFLIDYLVLSPFVSFVIYLIFQDSLSYFKKFPTALENQMAGVLIIISYLTVFSFFQALFLTYALATPGQYFLKLRYRFENGNHLILWRAFIRQLGFSFSIFLLGLPWLAILAHPLQLAFYDRLADGKLVSLKSNNEYIFFEKESTYWRSFYSTCLVFFVGLVGLYFSFKLEQVNGRVASYEKAKSENYLCKELDSVSTNQRLKFAIAMNITGLLSDNCLDREADFVLWKEVKSLMGLAYFAKSMTEDSTENISKYIEQACQTNEQFSCQLARSFNTHNFADLHKSLSREDGLLEDILNYEFEALNGGTSDKKFKLLSKIEKYDTHRLIKKYLISESLRNSQLVESKRKWASVDEKDEVTQPVTQARSPAEAQSKLPNKFQDWLDEL